VSVHPPYRFLEWDSTFFGVRIGRIESTRLTSDEVAKALDWASDQHLQCLYFLCEPDDDESVRLAEIHGFHLVDLRLSLQRRLESDGILALSQTEQGSVRPYRVQDRDAIEEIAATAYHDTRFYYDHRFGVDRATALYRTWARKSCDGDADAVFVAGQQQDVQGFITCHLQPARRGQIGLVGVDSGARGAGLGRLLVDAALAYFVEKGITEVEVATQGRNIAAQRLYQKCGFRSGSLHLWYHKWFGGSNDDG